MRQNFHSRVNVIAILLLPAAAILLAAFQSRAFAAVAIAPAPRSMTLSIGTTETLPYYVQDSGVKGPTAIIVGGMAGDEAAGACALDQIRSWRIVRGKLIVLPRADPSAVAASWRPPTATPKESGLGYSFPKNGKAESAPSPEVRNLWRMIQEQKPGWLLELREDSDFCRLDPKSAGNSVIVCPSAEADRAASLMLEAVNSTITSPSLKFQRLENPANGSLARAAAERLGARAIIIETTLKHQALSLRTRQHRIMIHRFLASQGMIDAATSVYQISGRESNPRTVWTAIYDAEGTGGSGASHVDEILNRAEGMRAVRIGPDEIINNALEQFNVVVFPGGTGKGISVALTDAGIRNVRSFVRQGGGYVGICAGAFLAADFSWGLKIINAKTVSPLWRRGRGMVKAELTDEGRKFLGDRSGAFEVLYANGPILKPAAISGLPAYESWAIFRTEMAKNNTPVGAMTGSPAIIAAPCDKGRVVCISPHPEQAKGLQDFIRRAVVWVAEAKK